MGEGEAVRQDLFRGHRVRVAKTMPDNMAHFDCDCDAIVIGSYADEHGGSKSEDFQTFTLLLLHSEGVTEVAWYPRECLTLMPASRDEGEAIIQAYNDFGGVE